MHMRPWNNKASRCGGRRRGRRSGGCGTAHARTHIVVDGYWIRGKLWRRITGLHIGSDRGRVRKSSLRDRILSAHRVLQGPSRGELSLESNRKSFICRISGGLLNLTRISIVPPNCVPTTALTTDQASRILQDIVSVVRLCAPRIYGL